MSRGPRTNAERVKSVMTRGLNANLHRQPAVAPVDEVRPELAPRRRTEPLAHRVPRNPDADALRRG
jgi:hypothetical protein